MLWVLGKAPLLFFLLAGLWFARWLVADFLLAIVAGVGFGIGAGGMFRRSKYGSQIRYPRRSQWSRAELDRHDEEFRRGAPRLWGREAGTYNPWPGDTIDMG
jgi:hypothetical protein